MGMGITSHIATGLMETVGATSRSRLKNLVGYIHENCLILLDLICQRWVLVCETQTGDSHPAVNLDMLVRNPRYRGLRRGDHIMLLRQHNEMIASCLRQLCRPTANRKAQLSSRGTSDTRTPSTGSAVLQVVADFLTARTPLERLRIPSVRSRIISFMRFQPLLAADGDNSDCPWPCQDVYTRFWQDPQVPTEGPIIYYEPLPPMLPLLGQKETLPPLQQGHEYTLVLDLDETLVHFYEENGTGHYAARPGAQEFLDRMSALGYEIVIFTASTQDYADWVIDQVDTDRRVHYRIYRQHALPWGPLYVKDLSRLGRDMEKILIIDNVQENFMLQPRNGIFIYNWYDDPQDRALFDLVPLLEEIIKTRAQVPEILDRYRDQIPTWAGFDQNFDGHWALGPEMSEEQDQPEIPLPRPVTGSFSAPRPAAQRQAVAPQQPPAGWMNQQPQPRLRGALQPVQPVYQFG
mmetsp:Transcript_133643/g.303050  ORF Transcript_133643/g.303050 Transcript_133643/m.303050 type:complete len:463 (+) Transcript_133643:534-1922(+)